MKKRTVWIYVGLFLVVNIVLYTYTLIRRAENEEPQYGDRFPKLAAYDSEGNEVHWAKRWALLLYFSDTGESGIENAAYGDTLYKRYGGKGLAVVGFMPKQRSQVSQFVRESAISYPVVPDKGETWKRVMGAQKTNADYAVVLVDPAGITRFTAAYARPRDLRLLVEKSLLGGVTYLPEGRSKLQIGDFLPSVGVVGVNQNNVQDLKDFRDTEIILFTAQCSTCSLETYLDLYKRLLMKERRARAVMVFSPQFAGVDVAGAAGRLGVAILPMFVAQRALAGVQDEYYSSDYYQDKVLLITTDISGRISGVKSLLSEDKIGDSDAAPDGSFSVPHHTTQLEEFPANKFLSNVHRIIQLNGHYYILDTGNHRVLVLNSAFQVERQIGEIGQGPGEFYYPRDMAVDSQGNINVMDSRRGRLEMFSQEGALLGEILDIPRNSPVSVNSKGEILVGQLSGESLVSVYGRNGKLLRSFGKPKLLSEFYGGHLEYLDKTYVKAINRINLTVDATNCVYVSFIGAPFFQKYDQEGNLLFEKRTGNAEDVIARYQKDRRSPGTMTFADEASIPIVTSGITVSPVSGDIFVASSWAYTSIFVTDAKGEGKAVLDPSPTSNLESISLSQDGGMIMARKLSSPGNGTGCMLRLPPELTIRR